MSMKLRTATGLAALLLLAGCGPVQDAGGTATSPAPSASPSTAAAAPVEAATTPPASTPPVAAATTQAAGGGTGTGSGGTGSGASCPANEYRNSSGTCVLRPTQAPAPPPGATAQCNDGSYSFSQHRSGTCSHHGGVRRWLVDLPA